MILTSGTTGTPKGAPRNEAGIDAAVSLLSRMPLRHGWRTHIAAPLFHTWGFAHLALAMLRRGDVGAPAAASGSRDSSAVAASMPASLRGAPFGVPVVPEVRIMIRLCSRRRGSRVGASPRRSATRG